MSEARKLLERFIKMYRENSPIGTLETLVKDVDEYLAKPAHAPDAFIVLDSDGDHLYSATHKQFCHDHINDLLMNESDLAGELVVRGFYAEPPASVQAESYSDVLRSLASYVGCGGYNADDPIDAKVFEDKIRYGIDLLLATVQAQATARRRLSDCAVMPKELTAENGAKALLMGEFYSEVVVQCEECDGDGEFDDNPCEECSGSGSITMRVPVSWTTIKAIYVMAVEHLIIKEQE